MRKFLTACICAILFANAFSQTDTLKKSTFLLRPYAETGVAFIRNSYLKNSYRTNSMFYWGFGVRFGDPVVNNFLPYIQFTRASTTVKTDSRDSLLSIRELCAGFAFPIKRFGLSMLRTKVAAIYANIKDDISKNFEEGAGLQLGLGWEGKVGKRSRFYLDYSYDLIKYNSSTFKDYDLGKLTFGIIL
jgi:hypothetical protein